VRVTIHADASVKLLLLPVVRRVELVGVQYRVPDVVLLDVVQDVSRFFSHRVGIGVDRIP